MVAERPPPPETTLPHAELKIIGSVADKTIGHSSVARPYQGTWRDGRDEELTITKDKEATTAMVVTRPLSSCWGKLR